MNIKEFLHKYGTDSVSLVLDKAARIMGTSLTVPNHDDMKIEITSISNDLREVLRGLDQSYVGTKHDVYMSENKDPITTELHLSDKTMVTVNPAELMTAMIQNLPSPLDEVFETRFTNLIRDMEAALRCRDLTAPFGHTG